MFEVTVEAGFSSGHYLRNYRGKCENPHGHNYRVFVTLIGEQLDEAGMLLDFKLLKQVMRPTVEYLDHKMINELEPFVSELNPPPRTSRGTSTTRPAPTSTRQPGAASA